MKFIILFLIITQTPSIVLASDPCKAIMQDILAKASTPSQDFITKNIELISQLDTQKVLSYAEIKKEKIILALNRKTGSNAYIVKSKNKLFVFDESIKNGWKEVDGKTMGYKTVDSFEKQYELVQSEFVIKTVKDGVIILPHSEFSDTAVTNLLKINKNENILRWKKELQNIISNPFLDDQGKVVNIPASSLLKAQFFDTTVKSNQNQKVTIMIVQGRAFYLTKGKPQSWTASKASAGLLQLKNYGFGFSDQKISFVMKDGQELTLNKLGLIGETAKNIEQALKEVPDDQKSIVHLFSKSYKDELQDLITSQAINIDLIKSIKLFKVSGKNNEYVALINGSAFYFSKGGIPLLETKKNWSLLDPKWYGFNNKIGAELILDDQYLLTFNRGSLSLLPLVEKNAQIIDEIISATNTPPQIKQVFSEFSAELKELMKTTRLNRSMILKAQFQTLFDEKTKLPLLFITAGDFQVLLNFKTVPGDSLFSKSRFHIIQEQTNLGFTKFEERSFIIPNQAKLTITAKGITSNIFDQVSYTKSAIDQMLSDEVEIAPFYKKIIATHRTKLEELIINNEITLDDLLPPNSSFAVSSKSKESFWVIHTNKDILIFKLDVSANTQPQSFKEFDFSHHGERVILESGQAIMKFRKMGFDIGQDMVVKQVDILDPHEVELVYLTKVKILLERSLSEAETERLIKAYGVGINEVGADGKSAGRIGNFTKEQIKTKKELLTSEGHFSNEDVDKLFVDYQL